MNKYKINSINLKDIATIGDLITLIIGIQKTYHEDEENDKGELFFVKYLDTLIKYCFHFVQLVPLCQTCPLHMFDLYRSIKSLYDECNTIAKYYSHSTSFVVYQDHMNNYVTSIFASDSFKEGLSDTFLPIGMDNFYFYNSKIFSYYLHKILYGGTAVAKNMYDFLNSINNKGKKSDIKKFYLLKQGIDCDNLILVIHQDTYFIYNTDYFALHPSIIRKIYNYRCENAYYFYTDKTSLHIDAIYDIINICLKKSNTEITNINISLLERNIDLINGDLGPKGFCRFMYENKCALPINLAKFIYNNEENMNKTYGYIQRSEKYLLENVYFMVNKNNFNEVLTAYIPYYMSRFYMRTHKYVPGELTKINDDKNVANSKSEMTMDMGTPHSVINKELVKYFNSIRINHFKTDTEEEEEEKRKDSDKNENICHIYLPDENGLMFFKKNKSTWEPLCVNWNPTCEN